MNETERERVSERTRKAGRYVITRAADIHHHVPAATAAAVVVVGGTRSNVSAHVLLIRTNQNIGGGGGSRVACHNKRYTTVCCPPNRESPVPYSVSGIRMPHKHYERRRRLRLLPSHYTLQP